MENIADIIIKGKKIFTSETTETIEAAIIITGDRIANLINVKEAESYCGPNTKVIDAGNRLVIPAFNDAHAHIFQAGMDIEPDCKVKLDECSSEQEAVETIKKFADEHPENTWIFGGGWNSDAWGGTLPGIKSLDAAIPDRSIFMLSWDFHTGWVNTEALRVAGILDDEEKLNHPDLYKDENGDPTGIVAELFAQDACRLASESIDIDMMIDAACETALSFGVGAMSNVWPTNGLTDEYLLKALLEHANKGELPVRISMFPEMTEDLASAKLYERELHHPFLRFGGVKNFVDGVCEAHTGYLTEPYADDDTTTGNPINDYGSLYKLVSNANAHNYSVRLHCIGNGAVKEALDVFEEVQRVQGNKGLRNAIEHIETACREDIPRFAKLGVIASMQPTHSVLNIEGYPQILGKKWVQYMWPVKSLMEANAIVAFGTDVPVYNFNPIHGLYAATQRKRPWDGTPEDGFVPNQKVSLARALQAYTLGAAIVANYDDVIGTIHPGKYADIAILDQDLFVASPDELVNAKVLYTIVGGKIAYQSSEADI